MLKISGLGRNPLENPSCLPHCKVGPGTFERKDVSIGPQHLSKRRNLSTYSFARGPKFGREESADDVSWFTERVFEPWFEAWPWGPWWRWNWHAWLGDSIVRLFFGGPKNPKELFLWWFQDVCALTEASKWDCWSWSMWCWSAEL